MELLDQSELESNGFVDEVDIDDNWFEFELQELVIVMARTWIGINKPGGVGRIVKIHINEGLFAK